MPDGQRLRYSRLRPLTLDERIFLSRQALYFFSPTAYREVCERIGKPPTKVGEPPREAIVPLDTYEFCTYLNNDGLFTDAEKHLQRINELLMQLAKSGVLTDFGPSKSAFGRHYYALRELTTLEKESYFQLAPALGAEFIQYMFSPVIVHITGKNSRGDVRAGTGLIIAPNWILTCAHVLDNIDPTQTFQYAKFKVLRNLSHSQIDVGLIEVAPALQCVEGLSFRDPNIAEAVYTMGYPRIPLSAKAPLVMQRGEVTSVGVTTILKRRLFLYSAIARPGNSGGPVVAETGHVVGIVSDEVSQKLLEEDDFQMPFHGGVRTSDIVKAVAELEPCIVVPVEDYE